MNRPNLDLATQKSVATILKNSPPLTYNEIAAQLDARETTLRKALRNMADTGKIRKILDVNPITRSPVNRYSLIDDSIDLVDTKRAATNRTPTPMNRCCKCMKLKEIAAYRQTQKWCKECAQTLGLLDHAKTSC